MLREALRDLGRLNRIFAASGPVLYGVERLWRSAGRPGRLTVLDAGAGAGDVNRRLLRWAVMRGVALQVLLADVTPEAEAAAIRLFRAEPRVRFVRLSVFDLPAGCADIVTASQFLHHFDDEQLAPVTRKMLDASRIGVVIADIHRHWLPWAAVWLVTRLISRNLYIRHDGPLSVAKGFRSRDFRALADAVHGADMTCRWRPLFRYAVTFARRKEEEPDGNRI